MSRNDVRGPTSALTDFLRVKFPVHFYSLMKSNPQHRHRASPLLLSPEEQGREHRHKPMSKQSRAPVQQQQLPPLAPVLVPVELLLVEQGREESVETIFTTM